MTFTESNTVEQMILDAVGKTFRPTRSQDRSVLLRLIRLG